MIAQHRCVNPVVTGSRRLCRHAITAPVQNSRCRNARSVVAHAGEGDLSVPHAMSVDEALSILGLKTGEGSFEQVCARL